MNTAVQPQPAHPQPSLPRILAVLTLAVAAAWVWFGRTPPIDRILGGKEITQLVASPQTIQAWRTVGSRKNTHELEGPEDRQALWKKDGDPTRVPPELAAELSRTLANGRSYDYHPDREKASVWGPCVVLNFSDGQASVDVFLSFADNNLIVMSPTNSDPRSSLAHADIEPSRAKLVRLAKRIFPRDERIQSLDETKVDGFMWPRQTRRK